MLDFPEKRDKTSRLLRNMQRQVSFHIYRSFGIIYVKCRVRLYLVFIFLLPSYIYIYIYIYICCFHPKINWVCHLKRQRLYSSQKYIYNDNLTVVEFSSGYIIYIKCICVWYLRVIYLRVLWENKPISSSVYNLWRGLQLRWTLFFNHPSFQSNRDNYKSFTLSEIEASISSCYIIMKHQYHYGLRF